MPPVQGANADGGGVHEFRCYHPVPVGTSNAELVELASAVTGRSTSLHVEETA